MRNKGKCDWAKLINLGALKRNSGFGGLAREAVSGSVCLADRLKPSTKNCLH